MARTIGVAGADAVRKSREEFAKAADLLRASKYPQRFDPADLAKIRHAVEQPSHWLAGAEGECRTAATLDRLPDDYVVFHDFHVREDNGERALWNIDHIIIGPPGVFVVDSKNRQLTDVEEANRSCSTAADIRATRGQARQVKNWLRTNGGEGFAGLFVQAVVVHVGGEAVVHRVDEEKAWVLPLRMLVRRIKAREPRLSPHEVALLVNALSQKRALTPSG